MTFGRCRPGRWLLESGNPEWVAVRGAPARHFPIARMPPLPFEPDALLQPLAPEAPSGPDLGYEPAFAALELAGAGDQQ